MLTQVSGSKSPELSCREDQENEVMFLEAMYGQDDGSQLTIHNTSVAVDTTFVFAHERDSREYSDYNSVVELNVTSESPNPISQLRVRLQFGLVPLYPLRIPAIGCKSLVGANSSQCFELVEHLNRCANDRVGQVMLLDLVIVAAEWLSSRVRELNQGSLHEMMMETQKQNEDQQRSMQHMETLPETSLPPSLEELTHQKEADMRRMWLLNRPELTGPPIRTKVDSSSFTANLSYTMSRFMRNQGTSGIKSILSSGSPASSLLQTIHVLQQALVQQQFLNAHLLAHWIEFSRSVTGEDSSNEILEYLTRESLLDSQQIDLVRFPGRIPTGSLFPQADGTSAPIALLTCPAERLGQRLTDLSSRSNKSDISGDMSIRNPVGPIGLSVVSRFKQDFEQLQYLGSGAFGDVWKVRNRLDGMFYAIKKVRIGRFNDSRTAEELVANNKVVNKILREVTTLGRIHSPYVLRYHQAWIEESPDDGEVTVNGPTAVPQIRVRGDDTLRSSSFFEHLANATSGGPLSGEHGSGSYSSDEASFSTKQLSLYIQTAFCPRTLSDFLANEGTSATVTDLWRLCRMMLEGLAHIHSHGIMHRDMKPSNIFIDSNGDIRIGDFGLATFDRGPETDALVDGDIPSKEGPELSTRVGTKLYSSPEQDGSTNGDYDERTDIYSLGIIFFELWYPFRTNYDRIEQLTKLKEGLVPGKFAESHPRQWKLISAMIHRNLQERPTATMILQSDLLPPRMEDDFLNDALRVVSNPNTPIFPKILKKLFSVDRQLIFSRIWPSVTPHQQLGPYLPQLPEPVVMEQRKNKICSTIQTIFEMHGAVRYSAPLFTSVAPESKSSREDEALLMDHNGALISARYDTRSNFAQTFASTLTDPHSQLPSDVVFKRYDICTVYRKPPRPGFQPIELIRGEFDIIGVKPVIAECQSLDLTADILSVFDDDIEWVRVCVNHRILYEFVLRQADISPTQQLAIQKSLIDVSYAPSTSSRLDKWEMMRKALISSGGSLADKQINALGRWFRTSTGSIADVFVALRAECDEDDAITNGAITEVSSLIDAIQRCQGARFRDSEYMLDLCFPPPSDDNDGLFFRVDVSYSSQPDIADTLVVGGRINSTLKKLIRGSVPGMVGITCNISKLVSNVTVAPCAIFGSPDVLVCAQRDSRLDGMTEEILVEQASVASEIHQMGLSADVYYASSSLQEQMEFASQRAFRYMVVLREKEINIVTEDGTRERVEDYNVSVRIISAAKGKQVREIVMKRSELRNHLAHRT